MNAAENPAAVDACVKLTETNFAPEVLLSPLPVLVDFWASNCGPCRMLAPALDELAREFAGRVKIAKLNVDDAPALANEYGVSAIPALLIFRQGQVVDQSVGVPPKKSLRARLEAQSG